MSYLNSRVYDNGLTVLDTEGTAIWLCSSEPADYAAAVATKLAESVVSIGAPQDKTGGGREVVVDAVVGGSVVATGDATHAVIVDATNSRVLASKSLSATKSVVSGSTWSADSFTIGIPGVA